MVARLLPEDGVLRAWFKAGLTAQECVELLRAQGTDVEPSTVYRAWNRLGLRRRQYYSQDLPWVVYPAHIKHTNLNRLRNVGRMRYYMCELHPQHRGLFERWISGATLTPDEVDEFDAISLTVFDPQAWPKEYVRFSNWWRRMRERGVVVHYTREQGVMLVPARPGIDRGFIREPDVPDDGQTIPPTSARCGRVGRGA